MNISKELIEEIMSGPIGRRLKIKTIVTSKDYIHWLKNFLKEYNEFSDQTFLYNSEAISEEDYNNVSYISYLFEVISDYFDEKGLSMQDPNSGNFPTYVATVNFEDFSIEIATVFGQGAITTVTEIKKGTGICDFNDILNFMNNKNKQMV